MLVLKFKERGCATLHRESDQKEMGTVVFVDNSIRVRWVESAVLEGMLVEFVYRKTLHTKRELDGLLSSL